MAFLLRICLFLCLLAAPLWGTRTYDSTATFEPPVESFTAPALLRALEADLSRGSHANAAQRIGGLLPDHADELVTVDEGGLISLGAWVNALPAKDRVSISREYRKQFESGAREAFEALRRDPTARPEAFCSVARRFPFSRTASWALVEAGDRAGRQGDAAASVVFYTLAQRAGWLPDETRAEALARALADSTSRLAGGGSPGTTKPAKADYRGRIICDGVWYNRREQAEAARYFPEIHGDVYYFVGARHVLAIKATGAPLWSYLAPDAWTRTAGTDRPVNSGRGSNYLPAIFHAQNRPQIIVVRQPRGAGREFCLRALRASDGKLLWSTESDSSMENLSPVGTPAIAGRYVYVTAVDFTPESATLVLAALDVMDGSLIFKTPLGMLPEMRRARTEPPGWDPFWEQTEPAVAGDAVYLTPNVGVVYAVDRFDGKIRWMRVYEHPERSVVLQKKDRRSGPPAAAPARVPPAIPELLRWRGTPVIAGQVLIAAPQDSSRTMGLDLQTGRVLWSHASDDAHTLFAATPTAALMAGSVIEALDPASGKPVWRLEPQRLRYISGPPALVEGTMYVPFSDFKIDPIDPATGRPAEAAARHPNFRLLMNGPAMRKSLEEANIHRSFAMPGVTPKK